MPRLTPLDPAQLSGDQKRVADEIIASRGGLRGPFDPWLRSPELATHAQQLGGYCRFGSVLPAQLRELAILLTGKRWKAQFEFWAHARLARQEGLPEDVIEAIRTGTPPTFPSDDQEVIYDFVTEYFASNRVADGTYQRALEAFGERGVVDLVGTVGYYGLVSMTLNVFDIGLPDGEAPLLA